MKQPLSILGFEDDAKPIQLIQKSVKDVKAKSFSYEEFASNIENCTSFENIKNPKQDFQYKNILPIPNLLTKTFMDLPSTDPYSVARAFFEQMHNYDSHLQDQSPTKSITEPDLKDDTESEDKSASEDEGNKSNPTSPTRVTKKPEFLKDFFHVIQFCHLCIKGKIPPILYSLASTPESRNWLSTLKLSLLPVPRNNSKRAASTDQTSSDEEEVSSPEQILSRKDHYLIHTMMKLQDTMDSNNLRLLSKKEEKVPGFRRLATHRKNLILNASSLPPFDTKADKPTEFYKTFLNKKSQFKAKDMMLHRFHLDKIVFNPSTSFVTNLWNGDFFWILPDSPSGISIFFCPETKSLNAAEIEKEKSFALADKIKSGD
jgi:hypothetical protein